MLLLHYYSAAAAAFALCCCSYVCCCVLLLLQLRFANAAAVFCCCCSLLRGSNPMVVTGSLAWVGTNSHNCGLIISSIKTNSTKEISNHDQVSIEELEYAQNALGEFGGNNRTGIAGTLHRISAIRNKNGRVVGLTCRLGRPVREIIDMTRDLLEYGKSILFLGRPGVGKTRVIRGISHVLSYELLKRGDHHPRIRTATEETLRQFCCCTFVLLLPLRFAPAAAAPAAAFCSCCCCILLLLMLLLHYYSAALLLRPASAAYALLLRFATAAAAFCYCCGCILLLLQFASWKQPHGSDGITCLGRNEFSQLWADHIFIKTNSTKEISNHDQVWNLIRYHSAQPRSLITSKNCLGSLDVKN
ncbi:UNVERIFIED_CONTAM: putative protein ycf45 [Sesamum angustifolium]|uniref:Uncharacterized protein n=1 Tax=Sesamum angustifolium TaxID=2727405 RepID=A0AAW2L5C2_9LAMI